MESDWVSKESSDGILSSILYGKVVLYSKTSHYVRSRLVNGKIYNYTSGNEAGVDLSCLPFTKTFPENSVGK